MEGLTGHIEFNSKGQRSNYALRIMQNSRDGLRQVSASLLDILCSQLHVTISKEAPTSRDAFLTPRLFSNDVHVAQRRPALKRERPVLGSSRSRLSDLDTRRNDPMQLACKQHTQGRLSTDTHQRIYVSQMNFMESSVHLYSGTRLRIDRHTSMDIHCTTISV